VDAERAPALRRLDDAGDQSCDLFRRTDEGLEKARRA
jgi:hypothetical protein